MAKPLIYVLDDEPEMGEFIGDVAEMMDFEAELFTDPAAFQDRIMAATPTAVFLDMTMPDMSGAQILRWLSDLGCRSAIVMMSGNTKEEVTEVSRSGSDLGLTMLEPLTKPIALSDLEASLQTIRQSLR